MTKKFHFSPISIAVMFLAAFFVTTLGVVAGAYAATDLESGQRLVTIHDRGIEKSVITDKNTLRDVFEEANIVIDPNDMVEPGLDEPLTSDNYQVNVYRARPVTVIDGNDKIRVMSAYQTPKQIAAHAGFTLRDEDIATMTLPSDPLADDMNLQLVIDRAIPVKLVLYGKSETIYTQAADVASFLREKDIILGGKDDMSVESSTAITANMSLRIWRNGKQTVTREEKVAFSVKQIKDANREVGYRKVKTPGINGKKMVTYEIVMKDGREVKRKVIQTVVTKQPKKQVEIVGTKLPPVAGPAEILSKINAASKRLGIDANRVATIAKCESGFNPRADSGYYKGLFQHDPNYWPGRAARYGFAGASIFDVNAQIGVSTSMMAEGGWSHWGCDPGA